jgi:hypothetical protein
LWHSAKWISKYFNSTGRQRILRLILINANNFKLDQLFHIKALYSGSRDVLLIFTSENKNMSWDLTVFNGIWPKVELKYFEIHFALCHNYILLITWIPILVNIPGESQTYHYYCIEKSAATYRVHFWNMTQLIGFQNN